MIDVKSVSFQERVGLHGQGVHLNLSLNDVMRLKDSSVGLLVVGSFFGLLFGFLCMSILFGGVGVFGGPFRTGFMCVFSSLAAVICLLRPKWGEDCGLLLFWGWMLYHFALLFGGEFSALAGILGCLFILYCFYEGALLFGSNRITHRALVAVVKAEKAG